MNILQSLQSLLLRLVPRHKSTPTNYPLHRVESSAPLTLRDLGDFGLSLTAVGKIISAEDTAVSDEAILHEMLEWAKDNNSAFAHEEYRLRVEALYGVVQSLYLHPSSRDIEAVLLETPLDPNGEPTRSIASYLRADDFAALQRIALEIDQRKGRFALKLPPKIRRHL